MQTPKGRAVSVDVPPRSSPQKTPPRSSPQKASPSPSPATSRTARHLKTTGSEAESASSQPFSRTPKDRSSKVLERKSPRSPVAEKKRPSKLSELESQLSQLQEDLKRTKEQLVLCELSKKDALHEAEEAKNQVVGLTAKLEESKIQFLELSASEEARLQELCKNSQERDSELEAVQKQNSVDLAALESALSEIQRLKSQLEAVVESDGYQTKDTIETESEFQRLQLDIAETRSLIEKLHFELSTCRESEAQAKSMASDTLQQLELAKMTVAALQADGTKTVEAYKALSSELEKSRAQVSSLEELVSKLQVDLVNASNRHSNDILLGDGQAQESVEIKESVQLKLDVNSMKSEIRELTSALEMAEAKYQEGRIQSTMEICSAYELVEEVKSSAAIRQAELETELKKTLADIEELKANLMDKETELQSISEENECLSMKIEKNQSGERHAEMEMEVNKSKADIAEFKASLMDKETELQSIAEENETLKSEIKKMSMEREKENQEACAEADAARTAEREGLMRLGYVTEEADKSNRRAARVTEQLEAAQAANSEMDAELRRLKVQSDQWRKAAEAAAAVLATGNNGKLMDRSGSLDGNYHPVTGKICSPYSEDMDDDSPKKKNNMLKKIGGLWKKGQK